VTPSLDSPYAVLWDMDGVLVDTARFHWQAWERLSQAEGFAMTHDDFRRTFGWRNEEILQDLLGSDISRRRASELGDRKEELYRDEVRGRVEPLPGAVGLLQGLREAGFRQAVASSAPRANIELILRELRIERDFGAVLCDRDVELGKPNPQVFLRAAEGLGVAPSHCLVIEDAVMGVRAARSAGMFCLAVTTTHPEEGLLEADRVVASLTEVTVEDVRRLIDREG
jgi:beta-phosphoglucomutase